jgi:hypothetical protein
MGRWMYGSTYSVPRHKMEVSGQLHAPAALPPGERALGTHWIVGWVGPSVSLQAVEKTKFCPCQESNPGRPGRLYID